MSRPKGIKETKPRQTLRRKRLLKAIGSSVTLREAGIKAGYSPVSNKLYSEGNKRYLRRYLGLSGNDLKTLEKKLAFLEEVNFNANDYKEVRACLEDRIRMQGGFKDSACVNTQVNIFQSFKDRILNDDSVENVETIDT